MCGYVYSIVVYVYLCLSVHVYVQNTYVFLYCIYGPLCNYIHVCVCVCVYVCVCLLTQSCKHV